MLSIRGYRSILCHVIFAVAICIVFAGCESMTPTSSIIPSSQPPQGTDRLNSTAWISSVKIADLDDDERVEIEKRLTSNICKYIAGIGYFNEVCLLSNKACEFGKDDLILNFEFDRYRVKWGIHPAYFPAALLTATLYIWFGGPIICDNSHFSATLIVQDSLHQKITQVSGEERQKENYGLYSAGKGTPTRTAYLKPRQARAALIEKLLNKALPQVQQFLGKREQN